MSAYLEVVFNLPVKKSFTYLAPDGVGAAPGFRVAAPFGKRRLTGYVVGAGSAPPEGIGEVREISRLVDSRELFGHDTVDLARWVSRMYMCSLGEALAAILPGGRRETEGDELPPDEDPREYPLAEGQSFHMSAADRVRRFRQFIRKARLDTVQVLLPIPLTTVAAIRGQPTGSSDSRPGSLRDRRWLLDNPVNSCIQSFCSLAAAATLQWVRLRLDFYLGGELPG